MKCILRSIGQASTGVEICYNDKGDMVKHGEQYIPIGINTCTQCTCMNGKAEMCISVLCSPPDNCRKYHVVTNKCCEFLCLDGDMQTGLRFFNKTILTRGEMKTYSTFSTSSVLNFVGAVRLFSCAIISAFLLIVFCVGCRQFRARREAWIRRFNQRQRLEQLNGTGGPGGAFGTGGGGPGHHLMNEHAFMRFGYFGLGGSVSGGRNGNGGGIGNGTMLQHRSVSLSRLLHIRFGNPRNNSVRPMDPLPDHIPLDRERHRHPMKKRLVQMQINIHNNCRQYFNRHRRVQHLYQQQNQTPYQPMPIQPITNGGNSIINHSMNHHLFGDTRPSLINQQPIQTLPTTIDSNQSQQQHQQIYLQSTIDQHNQSHLSMFDQNQPIIDTVASDPNYEHITILRIGGPGNDNENGIGNNGIHHSGYYTLRDNRRNGLIGGTNKSGTYDPYTNGYSDFRRTFQRPLSLKPQQSQTDLISNRNINNEHSLESTDGSNRIGKNGYYLRPKSHSLRSINSHNGGSQIHQSKVNNVTNMKPQCKIVNSSSNHSFEHVNLDEDQRSKSTGSCSSIVDIVNLFCISGVIINKNRSYIDDLLMIYWYIFPDPQQRNGQSNLSSLLEISMIL
ncbi:hypothetical protein RDWZM_007586 [Blomia tropicalis]|uniref:VWFC domain-containing protein n=1 Tax=Blomia tropicalis TaxID=40697 RepID=A0A9Q0RJ61_BLOTA|nr:hypothetical protein RDWZM_007586 [Blomia tropicalis]